ncbi:transposase, partial [Candidatus Mycobacterium methanotrophicum]
RGAVLRDVAVSIADGGRDISDVVVLGEQPRLLGPVASIPTVWRSLNELDTADIAAITLVRNRVREKAWDAVVARHGRVPPAPTCYGDLGETIVIRIDASLIDSHSDKQKAAGTFKGGYGFHPLMAWCDNTGELLAIIARAG